MTYLYQDNMILFLVRRFLSFTFGIQRNFLGGAKGRSGSGIIMRIRILQNYADPLDPDPQHCPTVLVNLSKTPFKGNLVKLRLKEN